MPYKRILMNQPPTALDMNSWEADGYSDIQLLGPVVGREEGDAPGQEKVVFVVYLYRSVIEAVRGVN